MAPASTAVYCYQDYVYSSSSSSSSSSSRRTSTSTSLLPQPFLPSFPLSLLASFRPSILPSSLPILKHPLLLSEQTIDVPVIVQSVNDFKKRTLATLQTMHQELCCPNRFLQLRLLYCDCCCYCDGSATAPAMKMTRATTIVPTTATKTTRTIITTTTTAITNNDHCSRDNRITARHGALVRGRQYRCWECRCHILSHVTMM